MRERFKDAEHLVRLVLLFIAGFLAFLVLRAVMVPGDFGVYGHFRSGSLEDNRDVPLSYAGRRACAECHEDAVEAKSAGKHAGVGCEACHGPLARHAGDPAEVIPERPDPADLCLTCHRVNVAKPAGFPQIDSEDHAGDMPCGECHEPHQPGIQ